MSKQIPSQELAYPAAHDNVGFHKPFHKGGCPNNWQKSTSEIVRISVPVIWSGTVVNELTSWITTSLGVKHGETLWARNQMTEFATKACTERKAVRRYCSVTREYVPHTAAYTINVLSTVEFRSSQAPSLQPTHSSFRFSSHWATQVHYEVVVCGRRSKRSHA